MAESNQSRKLTTRLGRRLRATKIQTVRGSIHVQEATGNTTRKIGKTNDKGGRVVKKSAKLAAVTVFISVIGFQSRATAVTVPADRPHDMGEKCGSFCYELPGHHPKYYIAKVNPEKYEDWAKKYDPAFIYEYEMKNEADTEQGKRRKTKDHRNGDGTNHLMSRKDTS